jgi:hypothetical protein
VKLPRASIAGLMTLVLFVAVNCAVLRWILPPSSPWTEVFILGALPMANLPAVGLLPWFRHQGDRAKIGGFRVGFEICGALALAAFVGLSLYFADFFFRIPQSLLSPYVILRPGLGLVSFALLLFLGPQIAFALLGGCLGKLISRKRSAHQAAGMKPTAKRMGGVDGPTAPTSLVSAPE